MRIHFLSSRTFKSHCFTYPVRVFGDSLRDCGISVKFFFRPKRSLLQCDVLCIVGDYFAKRSAMSHLEIAARLEQYRPRVGALVWCDVTDSTGTTAFHVLPMVDLYLKNQLLRDRIEYTKHFYGLRCYTDYYHRRLGIRDESNSRRLAANANDLRKLAVSWNIGLGDYTSFGTIGRRIRILWPWSTYKNTSHCRAAVPRDLDVCYRASRHYKRATVSYQREETLQRLVAFRSKNRYKITTEGRVPYRSYRAELNRSRVIPSPFGLGEICFRDFESFLSGGVLFKPTMEHLDTWPDYFVPEKTYVPHDWSFSDFETKLFSLLDSPERCRTLAEAAQDLYVGSRSPGFGEVFSRRFASLMRSALQQGSAGLQSSALARHIDRAAIVNVSSAVRAAGFGLDVRKQ